MADPARIGAGLIREQGMDTNDLGFWRENWPENERSDSGNRDFPAEWVTVDDAIGIDDDGDGLQGIKKGRILRNVCMYV